MIALHPNFLRRYPHCFAVIAILLAFARVAPAHAQFTVYPMVSAVDAAGDGSTRVSAHSRSDATQFVKVRVVRLDHPATPQEREIEVDGIDGKDLLVAPRRIVLPAGASRSVRVLLQGSPLKETFYRVYFQPVTALDSDDAAVTGSHSGGASAAVGLSFGFGASVRAMPAEKNLHLQIDPARKRLLNTGNVRVGLVRLGRCSRPASLDQCEWTDIERSVYPDEGLDLPFAPDQRRLVAHIRTTGDPVERDIDVQ